MIGKSRSEIWIFTVIYFLDIFGDDHISGVMVRVLGSSSIDRRIELLLDQSQDNKTGICSFSAKHVALRRKDKYQLNRNQDNVSEWSDMYTRRLLFQGTSTINQTSTLRIPNVPVWLLFAIGGLGLGLG